MDKLRIAVWHNLPTGGGKRQLYNHVKGLVERGHYVEAWCPDNAKTDFLPLSDLVRENIVPLTPDPATGGHSSRGFEAVKRLLLAMEKHCEICGEQINAGDFDVLFANSCLFFRTTPIAKYVNIPSVLYLGEPYRNFYEALPELPWIAPAGVIEGLPSRRALQDDPEDVRRLNGMRLQAREELEFARKFDLILVNSAFSRESILRAYGIESKVCYLGIDTDHYKPSGEPNEKYVIGVGYIYHGKGVDRAIRAVGAVPKEKRPALVWVGDNASQSDLQKYNTLAEQLDVKFKVKIQVKDAELISLMSKAVAMIYTSRLEPFGLAPLEANACGTPVVGIAEGGIRETIADGVNGFLASDDAPQTLGNLISRFIDDPLLSAEMGLRAREHVKTNWNMRFCTDNIESHLMQLVEKDGSKGIRDLLASQTELDKLSIPHDLRMNIEELRVTDGKMCIKGWAFIDDGKGSLDSRIFVVLRYGTNSRLVPADPVSRKDVTAYFGGKINYDLSGFSVGTKLPLEDISDIAIIVKRGKNTSLSIVKDRPKDTPSECTGAAASRSLPEDLTNQADATPKKRLISSKEIIYFSRFYAISTAGGGCRRTAQIADALKDLDFAFVSSRDYYDWKYKESSGYQEYLKAGVLPADYLEKWSPGRRDDIAFMHYISWCWSNELNAPPPPKLALVDDPLYFSPLVKSLALKGIPVVALCHNIETLSRAQLLDKYQAELLNYELSLLSLCSLVVTISREETVFLNNFNIDTYFLPYYPVRDIVERMLSIREKRRSRKKEDYLLVGTAHNPPTMAGMKEIIQKWSSMNNFMDNARLLIAGYGSEPLKDLADGTDVVYKGAVSDEELGGILSNIKACIVYQSDGSGALTKICEFLLAGVPVLANSHAARSYYNTPGVVEFKCIHDIAQASKMLDSEQIEIGTPEPPDSNSLLINTRKLLDTAQSLEVSEMKSFVERMLSSGKSPAETDGISDGLKRMIQDAIKAHDNKLREERDAISAHRDALLNSLSWRLTAPLRYIARFFIGA